MRKIKVLHFPLAKIGGGVTNYVIKNNDFINKDIFQFDCATQYIDLELEKIFKLNGGNVYRFDVKNFREDFSKILDNGYDVVHLHTSCWKGLMAEEIAIDKNIQKIIVHSHSSNLEYKNDEQYTRDLMKHNEVKEKFNDTLATDFWACSTTAADWLFGSNINKNKIKLMKNAIELNKYSLNTEVRNKIRKKLFIEDKYVIGHIGRFTYQKNNEFIIECFKKVYENNKNVVLVLKGDGELKPIIHKLISDYGIEKNVIILDVDSNIKVSELYQALDLFILPSRYEGLPLVSVEAQASGLKCLISNKVTTECSIVEGLVDFLPLDLEEWVKKIKYIIANGYKRKNTDEEIKRAGYDLSTQIKVLEEEYLN